MLHRSAIYTLRGMHIVIAGPHMATAGGLRTPEAAGSFSRSLGCPQPSELERAFCNKFVLIDAIDTGSSKPESYVEIENI